MFAPPVARSKSPSPEIGPTSRRTDQSRPARRSLEPVDTPLAWDFGAAPARPPAAVQADHPDRPEVTRRPAHAVGRQEVPLPTGSTKVLDPSQLNSSQDLGALPYADLVALLEAIKAWLRNQSESTPAVLRLEQVADALRAEIDRRDRAGVRGAGKPARPATAPKPQMLAERRSAPFRDEDEMRREVSHMEAWLNQGGLSAPDRVAVRARLDAVQPLAGTIDHFAFDGSDVPQSQMAKLRPLARQIAEAPRAPVRLVGHTDPVGAHDYNVALGRMRANEVMRFLKAALRRVAPGRADTQFDIFSPGETEPVASNETEAGRERNRRVEVYVPAAGPWSAEKARPQTKAPVKRRDPEKVDDGGGDDEPIVHLPTIIDDPVPFDPLDLTRQRDAVQVSTQRDDSDHPILSALRSVAKTLGLSLSLGIVMLPETTLGALIGAALSALLEKGVTNEGIGLAGERVAEMLLEHELGDRNAVYNVNEFFLTKAGNPRKNFPLIDLMYQEGLPSVKSLSILSDAPIESRITYLVDELFEGVGLTSPAQRYDRVEKTAKFFMNNRDMILNSKWRNAVPDLIREARTLEQMKDAVTKLYELRVPDDIVERVRDRASLRLFKEWGVEANVRGEARLFGRKLTTADAKKAQEIIGRVKGLGLTSSDLKAVVEIAKEQFQQKKK